MGFLEKVYENSLALELKKAGLVIEQQKPIQVRYEGTLVGEYFADLLVENKIVIELKATKTLEEQHLAQCLNHLKATGDKICLLINFGKTRVEIKRIAL